MDSSKIDLDVVLSQIQINKEDIQCPQHNQEIVNICIASENQDKLLEILCSKCLIDDHVQNYVECASYPNQFFREIQSSLANPSQNKTDSQRAYEEQKSFAKIEDFFQQTFNDLTKIEDMIKELQILLELYYKQFQSFKDQSDVSDGTQIPNLLSKLAESKNFMDISNTIRLFKDFQHSQNQVFPLNLQAASLFGKQELYQIFEVERLHNNFKELKKTIDSVDENLVILARNFDGADRQYYFSSFNQSPTISLVNQFLIKQNENARDLQLNQIVLIEPDFSEHDSMIRGFEIKQKIGFISIGVCHQKLMIDNQLRFDFDKINHGMYSITSNGDSLSHEWVGYKPNYMRFSQKNVVIVFYDPKIQLVKFQIEGQQQQTRAIKIPQNINDSLCLFVSLYSNFDSVEIINNPQYLKW